MAKHRKCAARHGRHTFRKSGIFAQFAKLSSFSSSDSSYSTVDQSALHSESLHARQFIRRYGKFKLCLFWHVISGIITLYSQIELTAFFMQGDLKSAVSYYKSSLDIDPDFEPAITRLRVIQCLLLFDDKKTAMSEILWNVSWFLEFPQISNVMRFRRIVKCAFFYTDITGEWESMSITLLEAMKKQLRIIIIICIYIYIF